MKASSRRYRRAVAAGPVRRLRRQKPRPRRRSTPACPGGQTGSPHAHRSVARKGTARHAQVPPVHYLDEHKANRYCENLDRHPEVSTGRRSTHLTPIAVQTNPASSEAASAPPRRACRRARGRQGQALRVAAKWRPALTAARHDGAQKLRSGRKNGFVEVKQKNENQAIYVPNFCDQDK